MSMFVEVTRQVRQINDMILLNMKNGKNDGAVETYEIKKHLDVTKNWFIRISWTNKKTFLLLLIDDVRCIWTISLLLKSIWNCRPKDAVMSVCEQRIWSSYDQVPMDNDRTALPPSTLDDVMMVDRIWFRTLEAEEQAWVLTELVTISGGPLMWEVLKHAQQVYEKHAERQLENLQECEVVYEPPPEKKAISEPIKKDQTPHRKTSVTQGSDSAKSGLGQAQKELETNLSLWASTVTSMKDYMKLEELEMTFKDGKKKKIWKVNRPKQEVVETVDMIQLLPSSISKRIFMYIPLHQLGDCARVNKYWAFLVDEIKAELLARQKIDIELEKLREIVIRHDFNLDLMSTSENTTPTCGSSSKQISKIKKDTNIQKNKKPRSHLFGTEQAQAQARVQAQAQARAQAQAQARAQAQAQARARARADRKARRLQGEFKPIRNLTDCTERLEVRGAADENIWKWCSKVIKLSKENPLQEDNGNNEGLLTLGNNIFPCPLMSHNLNVSVNPPVDPTYKVRVTTEANNSQCKEVAAREMEGLLRYSLWSKDFSSLYPVSKVSSHILNECKNK